MDFLSRYWAIKEVVRKFQEIRIATLSLVLFLATFCAADYEGYSQNIYSYNSPGSDCYCQLAYGEEPIAPIAVMVLDVGDKDLQHYLQDNKFLHSGVFTDIQFLYIKIINLGNVNRKRCLDILAKRSTRLKRINQKVVFLVEEWEPSNVIVQEMDNNGLSITRILLANDGFQNLHEEVEKRVIGEPYKIFKPLSESEFMYQQKMANYVKNFDLSLFFSPTVLLGDQLGLDRGAISSYGISFSKNFKANQTARFTIGTSLRIPNQSAVQSRVQADVQSAVFAGDDSLNINQNISGHILLFSQLAYKYYLSRDKRFRWFLGGGVGFTNVTSISGTIDETIDLTAVDLNNPSSFQDAFDPDEISPELNQTNENYLSGLLEFGFEYRMTPGAKLHASLPVRNYFDRNVNSAGTASFGLNFGLSFTINPGKLGQFAKSEL
jgi:hypothetical protein